ncbi:MCP four helix bundle domain-containing protein [bacterium]|nr:MCP four helix bundle domain-containing protein [bacterium]
MRVQSRILLGYSPVLAILAALLTLAIATSTLSARASDRAFDKTLPAIVAGEELLSLARNLEALEYVYFLEVEAPAQGARAMAEFDRASQEFEGYYQSAEAVADTPVERRYLADIDQAYKTFITIDRQIRERLAKGQVAAAYRLNATESLVAYERFSRSASALVAYNREQLVTARSAIAHRRNTMLALLAGAGVLALLLGLWVGVRLARILARPLAELEQGAEQIAKGTFKLPPPSREVAGIAEIRGLYDALAWMVRSLEGLARDLREANASLERKVASRTAALEETKRALEATVAELRSLDKLKSDFLSVVSHELLTPINFVTGYGSTLSEGLLGELSDVQREAVDKMLEGASRLTRIVRNLLDYTRMEAGELSVRSQPVDVAELLHETYAEFAPLFARKDLALSLSLPPELPLAWGDPARIHQVLGELLDNAAKFTGSGGSVGIEAQCAADAVEITVQDTGVGIAPDVLPHVFERFYQGDSTSTRAYGGTGIGLTLSKRLAEEMGGALAIASVLGEGTRAVLRLRRSTPLG